MVERLSPEPRRFDRDREVFLQYRLAREIRKTLWTQSGLKLPLIVASGCRDDALFTHSGFSLTNEFERLPEKRLEGSGRPGGNRLPDRCFRGGTLASEIRQRG